MRWATKVAALFLLALWVPVTVHCALERLPGMQWLQCCCADESPQAPADCNKQSCGSVETGAFKLEDRSSSIAAPPLLPGCVLTGDLPLDAAPPLEEVDSGPAPPELPKAWQFSHRAALPPRAPSCHF